MCIDIKGKTSMRFLMLMMPFISHSVMGQISYRVSLDADKITYRIFMKSVDSILL